MKKMTMSLLVLGLAVSLTTPAGALEYTIGAPDGAAYGKPTSVEVVQTPDGGAARNEDISKNATLIPPAFGSNTSNLLDSGVYLTPDLVPSGQAGVGMIGGGPLLPPPVDVSYVTESVQEVRPTPGFTDVTGDLYYDNGSLGTLKIPAIGLTVKVYEGTDSKALAKGAGHFEETSIWIGNVAIAGHNRGTNCYFGNIHTLELGDKITLSTKLGTRTYEVTSVSKVGETDRSALASSVENRITLYTCVRDQRDQRWCVQAVEAV